MCKQVQISFVQGGHQHEIELNRNLCIEKKILQIRMIAKLSFVIDSDINASIIIIIELKIIDILEI